MLNQKITKILNFLNNEELNDFISSYIDEHTNSSRMTSDSTSFEAESYALTEIVLPELYKKEQDDVKRDVLQNSYNIDEFSDSLPPELKTQFATLKKETKNYTLRLLDFFDYNYNYLTPLGIDIFKPNMYQILETILPVLSKLDNGVSFYDLQPKEQNVYNEIFLSLHHFLGENFDNPYTNIIHI